VTTRRTTLDSGLRVVTETVPGLHSATLGAWVAAGARDESHAAGEWGASHFLEHLLFKGTAERSAREIAAAVESVGGEINAFTTHEQTVFYVRVPASELALGVEILTDIVWRPAFRPEEIESERQVILEEIGMRDDTPDDLVHDLLGRALFPEHELGNEVIGSRDSIAAMTRDTIAGYHEANYMPGNIVFAAAGGFDDDAFLRLLDDHARADGDAPPRRPDAPLPPPAPRASIGRETEQAHLTVGLRALPSLDPDRYALGVLNQALGGGMSSRLFQEIREERGLAYSVYSYRAEFRDAGMLVAYAGTAPDRAPETLQLVHDQLDRLVAEGTLPDDELAAARGHITGALAMSLETSASRMRRIGRAELVEGEVRSIDDVIASIEAVEAADIARVIDRILRDAPRTLAVVGPDGVLDGVVDTALT
jgi:predicted Zn-dependent peptidase